MLLDKRFNRVKAKINNYYIPNYGKNADLSFCHYGKVKCKLLHSKDDSIVFPDQIFIPTDVDNFKWIQPLTFLVNLLVQDNEVINCGFYVDISAGNTLKIEFTNQDLLSIFHDNSTLFNCKIFGPENIDEFFTGEGKFINDIPYINLYHHTLPRFKELITKSSTLNLSQWNIQGTKKLSNLGYFYLTCLESIEADNDLIQIAMSSDGNIYLLLDNYEQPRIVSNNATENIRNGVLELKVYRENTKNRKSTLKFLVDSTIIAPKHLWKHFPNDNAVYYEVCMPFIYRIGGEFEKTLKYDNNIITNQDNIKILAYQVVGEANSFRGLEAPYDEENTTSLFKIEKLNDKTNILEFWFENKNSDQYSGKNVDLQSFQKKPPNIAD